MFGIYIALDIMTRVFLKVSLVFLQDPTEQMFSPHLSESRRGLEPISYIGALVSTLLHATVLMFLHNLLNVLVQIASKMGLQQQKKLSD
jgi:hypothetical protein